MTMPTLDASRLIVRDTASRPGRFISVSPETTVLDHLQYGRIRLDSATPSVSFDTEKRETALLNLRGACRVRVNGDEHRLDQYDSIYIPRGSRVEVATAAGVDLVECAAEVEGNYPLQVVRYADIQKDGKLKFTTGQPAAMRDLNIAIGKNVEAGRILLGFTFSHPGHWTSWPPHEHTSMLEEAYLYFDMPAPAFGIQLVYTNPERPEFVEIVRDGDVVLMPAGFHPNVAAPGHTINFVWMMAARREVEDRQFGVVNVQPSFAEKGSGLEASR